MCSFDPYFKNWSDTDYISPGGQVAIRYQNELIYHQSFGYADIEHEIPITDQTIFHVASVSKQFTVMAILLLNDQGKLKLDEDIRVYIPDLVHFTEPVTIRQMINNVSGIRDQWELFILSGTRIDDTITQKDALRMIQQQTALNFSPQSQFMYSNSNFTLLAEIVERISGQSLNEFCQQHIFNPLGMSDTCFKEQYWQPIKNRCQSYYDNGNGIFSNHVLNYGCYGATSLNTHCTDLLKWMNNFTTHQVGSTQLFQEMMTVPSLTDSHQTTEYGGGLFIGELSGHPYFEHSGVDAGYRAQMLSFPEDKLDIIILANVQNIPIGQVAFNIAKDILKIDSPAMTQNLDQFDKDKHNNVIDIDKQKIFYYESKDGTPRLLKLTKQEDQVYIQGEYSQLPLEQIDAVTYKLPFQNQWLILSDQSFIIMDKVTYPIQMISISNIDNTLLGNYYCSDIATQFSIATDKNQAYIQNLRLGSQELYQIDSETWVFGATDTFKLVKDHDNLILDGSRIRQLKFIKSDYSL